MSSIQSIDQVIGQSHQMLLTIKKEMEQMYLNVHYEEWINVQHNDDFNNTLNKMINSYFPILDQRLCLIMAICLRF